MNYALRPSKHIERRMVFEALRKLDRISNIGNYRYVGFGSPFFVDFRLAHRELSIELMTNIEREVTDQARFDFNRPFGFIDLEWGESADVLEELGWSERAIVWLDFDKPLSTEEIASIQIVAGLVPSGSVILVTVNAEPERPIEDRIEIMQERLGDYMPFDLTDPDLLGGWSTAGLYRSIIHDVLEQELTIRNQGVSPQSAMLYRQWFNFNYRDNTRMLTTGGVVFDAGLTAQVDGLGMAEFPFAGLGPDPYEIKLPNLTLREMTHLESSFPCAPQDAGLPFLSDEAITQHQDVYRYCPRFADVDV